jgi:predicted ATPase/transcriptional regulator with XRE-family HTH domain
MDSTRSLGAWIKERRRDLDLTQEALAEQAGCSSDAIKKIEAGTLRPSTQLAEAVAAVLGVPSAQRPEVVCWMRADPPLMTGDAPLSSNAWMKGQRRTLGLTQAALAGRVGCSLDTIKKVEAGTLRPSRQLAQLLATELGVPPAERAEVIRRLRTAPPPPTPAPAIVAASTGRGAGGRRLPIPLTALIGREADVESVGTMLLKAETRLVTLVGPPGIGKTRLALAAAHRLHEEFADGVWFVELAPLTDPALVVPTLFTALGLSERSGPALLTHLTGFLQDKQMLLVLDNFEHLLAAAEVVDALLKAAPALKVLATSRTPLRVYGEKEFPVPALPVPPDTQAAPHDLGQYEAVRLFVERARDVLPEFALSAANASAVAAICARLDGLPLAIELAAARIRLFPPAALLARLERRLPLLTGGARTLPARQQTLRAAIAWSYDLLDAREQRLFRRLGVFQGGATLEAIAAVCNADCDLDVLAGVEALVSQSLLQQREGRNREARFWMLETIKEYAGEKLAASGESPLLSEQHLSYFLTLAETAAPELRGPQQVAWSHRLEAEHDNLRAALRWAIDNLETETGLRLAGALFWFWYAHDAFSEGRAWLANLLALPASRGATAVARIKALNAAAALAFRQNDAASAMPLLKASLALAREVGDDMGIAWALHNYAMIAHYQGDYTQAVALSEQSLRLYRQIDDSWGIAASLLNLGNVMMSQGNYEQATARYDECLKVCRQAGNKRGMAFTLHQQGSVAQHQGDYDRASTLLGKSLLLFREIGEVWGIRWSGTVLGRVALHQGDYEQAAVVLEESLAAARKFDDKKDRAFALIVLGNRTFKQGNYGRTVLLSEASLRQCRELSAKWRTAAGLEGLAAITGVQSQSERAARLCGVAMALREAIGAILAARRTPRA